VGMHNDNPIRRAKFLAVRFCICRLISPDSGIS
jgi:hypothetical protein